MAQYDIPFLQENAAGKLVQTLLTPTGARQELTCAATTRVPTLWTRSAAGLSVLANGSATTIAAPSTWYKFTLFGTADAAVVASASTTNDEITVAEAGLYLVMFTCSFFTAGASKVISWAAAVGGTPLANVRATFKPGGTDLVHCSGMGLVSLSAASVVSLMVQNATDASNVTGQDVTLSLVQVG